MRFDLTWPWMLVVSCTPLEERVELFDAGWCAPPRNAQATCVIDGDTLDLVDCDASDDSSDDERIRLLGVDAPEVAHGAEVADCFGEDATAYLEHILQGRSVRLEFDTECTDDTESQRTLAWVFISGDEDDALREELAFLGDLGVQDDGSWEVLVNEMVIRAGYAIVYDKYDDVRYYERLLEAERQAYLAGLGLWTECEG